MSSGCRQITDCVRLVSSAARLDLAVRRPPRMGYRSVSEALVSVRQDPPQAHPHATALPWWRMIGLGNSVIFPTSTPPRLAMS